MSIPEVVQLNSDLSEHAPLSHLDELPIHQSTQPLRLVATTDPRAFERYWFTMQDDDGEFLVVTGIGTYPNLGTVDAYALIVIDGTQTVVRSHRPMSQHRADLSSGPLRFEPVEAFREWRLQLLDNSMDFTFDLRWRDSKRAVFSRVSDTPIPGVLDKRLLHNWCGYETFGRVSGTLHYRGKTLGVSGESTRGSRDHHWGTRDGVAGYELEHTRPYRSYKGEPMGSSHLGQWVEFRDWSIWGPRMLFNIGDMEHPQAAPVKVLEQKLRFDPVTRHLIGGIVVNQLPSGEAREVQYEPIGEQCAYLRAAGYTGCNGLGTPEGNLHHGMPVGTLVSGETYDLSDPEVRIRIEGFEDRLVRATCNGETTVGILESRNPAIHAMASQNIVYSVLD
jgi:hypothetical protein